MNTTTQNIKLESLRKAETFLSETIVGASLESFTVYSIELQLKFLSLKTEKYGECECTYEERGKRKEERGNYNTNITEEKLKACMKPRPEQDVEDE